jgi:5-methylcytosine-specific restriction endonuclease McrA
MVVSTRCFYCGVSTVSGKGAAKKENGLTKDHMIPKSRGGKKLSNNIIGSCVKCNREKGCLTYEEFRVVMALRKNYISHIPAKVFSGETDYRDIL